MTVHEGARAEAAPAHERQPAGEWWPAGAPADEDVPAGAPTPRRAAVTASAAAATAVLMAALWLRAPRELYLAAVFAATAVGVWAAWQVGTRWARGAAGAFALAAVAFIVPGAAAQRALRQLPTSGTHEDLRAAAAADALARAVGEASRRTLALADAVAEAVARADAGAAGGDLFAALESVGGVGADPRPDDGERATAVFRRDTLVAWAGPWRLRPDVLGVHAGVGVARTPFYVVLHAHARRGPWRAVAASLVHADPPGDAVAVPLDRAVARAFGVRGFAFPADVAPAPGVAGARVPADPVAVALRARPLVPGPAEARERALEEGRRDAAPALLLMALVWVSAVWRRTPGRGRHARRGLLGRRVGALLVPGAVLAVAPLNALSNASRAFDPSVYYSKVGGRFTSSVGALTLTGLLLLVALFAALRAGARVPSRGAALAVVLGLATGTPFLLRELSRGIMPPAGGTPVWLWVAWQVSLFVIAAALLTAAAVAGRSALGAERGLPPQVAPALAAGAAFAGPLLWNAPAGWPGWYPLLWALTVAALAFTRRSGALLVAAAAVAGLGSATMVWSATARRRVESAERDVRGLVAPDPEALRLVERLGDALTDSARAGGLTLVDPGGSALLRAYTRSPLAAAGYPVALALWAPDSVAGFPLPDRLAARVATAQWRVDSTALGGVVAETRRTAAPARRTVAADVGAATVFATPLADGRTLSITLFPRTRLLPDDPVGGLLGQAVGPEGEPPYTLALVDRPPAAGSGPAGDVAMDLALAAPLVPPARWARQGDEIHGDWVLPLPGGPARAHAEVALRSIAELAPRGALLTLVDLALAGALWSLPALADGALGRARRRWRMAWLSSFRARITLALLGFSAAPTLAFAFWSYRQLQVGDRESRALLVRETLRDALAEGAGAATPPALAAASARVGTPLLAYVNGVLAGASEPAVAELAPFGRTLPRDQMRRLGYGGEVTAAGEVRAGGRDALLGYRAALGPGGGRVVLAAPTRLDDFALDQRRRDLGFLVLLAAVGGGLAALWLSGLAARQLARPVGVLRRAAIAIGEGDHDPRQLAAALDVASAAPPAAGLRALWRPTAWRFADPPAEFRPVFGAFGQMAADLAVGREALEAARRRTAAVLRDVASGVLAVDADARVTLANPRVEALLGRPMPRGSALDGRGPAMLAARVRAFVWRGGPASDEDAFDVEAGGRQLRARLTRLGGPDGGAVLTLDDVTELARAERVLAWGEMARQVAHEIKNPLTPIRLGVQLLRRAHRDHRADFGAMLETTVDRVLAEIDRLDEIARSFSKYGTAPDRRAPAEPLDAAAVARDVVALERLGQGAVLWETEGADAPAFALARDGELREVLLNLLENARLANARRVLVRVARADGRVAIAVADDGDGIPADVLPRIFEPHFSTRTSGSGLGLAISRRLVEAWGGEMAAESRRGPDGSGTTVTLRLRAAPAPTPAIATAAVAPR